MNQLHEECGVFGIYASSRCPLANMVYYGLYALQHRGQESCGIVVNDDGVFTSKKDLGLVNEVFSRDDLRVQHSRCVISRVSAAYRILDYRFPQVSFIVTTTHAFIHCST